MWIDVLLGWIAFVIAVLAFFHGAQGGSGRSYWGVILLCVFVLMIVFGVRDAEPTEEDASQRWQQIPPRGWLSFLGTGETVCAWPDWPE